MPRFPGFTPPRAPRPRESFFSPEATKVKQRAAQIRKSGVPAGFKDLDQVKAVTKGMVDVLHQGKIKLKDTIIVLRGSAATGYRTNSKGLYNDEEKFDFGPKKSDYDVAMSGKGILAWAKEKKLEFGEDGRIGPLSIERLEGLGLAGLLPKRINGVDRKVSVVIFRREAWMKEPPHVVLYNRGKLSPDSPGPEMYLLGE